MIKCKNKCPYEKYDGCCVDCIDRETCDESCDLTVNVDKCEDAIFDEETALATFQNQHLVVLQKIASVVNMKKQCEAQEKELKDQLKKAMEEYGIKKFESDILNITYVAETTSTSVDSAKLKRKYPQVAEECSKTSKKSSYIKVEVKEGGN